MEKENTKIGVEIKKLNNTVHRAIAYYAKMAGMDEVTLMHGWIIQYLYENREKEVFQKDIEQQFSLRGSSASQLLKRMEGASLIRRVGVDGDKRLKKIVLTRLAEENCERHLKEIKRLEGLLSKDITDKELAVFFSVVEKIEKNIDKELCEKSKKEV